MPPNSEIEKLERRWKENPKGTVFAPYAEVLRKHGDHPLAREVLRQGLELHPDHIPGNIVLGRCCLDLGEDGPAEAAFTHVLELDSENVIALKALADITERQGRLLEASHWLTRLVAVDPSNDEARDQLTRVEASREAAAAVITGQISAQGGAATPPEEVAEATSTVEVATGVIGESGEYRTPAAAASVAPPEAPAVPPAPPPAVATEAASLLGLDEAETVPAIPVFARQVEPPRIHELQTTELELPPPTEPQEAVEGMMVDEAFTPPSAEAAPAAPAVPGLELTIASEEAHSIELRPSGATEFQSPDAANELLDLKPGSSEFQVPDASSELSLKVTGASEYQTPSGSEELLARASQAVPEEPAEPVEELLPAEQPPSWAAEPYPTELSSLAEAPTEELHARPMPSLSMRPDPVPPAVEVEASPEPEPEPEAPLAEAAAPESEAPAEILELDTAAAAMEEAGPVAALTGPDEFAAPAETPATGDSVEEPASLKLIFPDERVEPEAPRRRISEEALEPVAAAPEAVSEAAEAEPVHGEPELVATETMAELYVRQGHFEEAENVFRALLARQPNDLRLAARVREVEALRLAGRRRLSYVATDTGGESVESFFRALANARPGSTGARGQEPAAVLGSGAVEESDEPAPTRPASDPLSLSAIFGEEPAAQSRSAAPPAAPPPARPGPDAFSFDQFFGGAPTAGPAPSIRQSGPQSDEDLDQFQHWLKSLKR